jgi:hypothetical protein
MKPSSRISSACELADIIRATTQILNHLFYNIEVHIFQVAALQGKRVISIATGSLHCVACTDQVSIYNQRHNGNVSPSKQLG